MFVLHHNVRQKKNLGGLPFPGKMPPGAWPYWCCGRKLGPWGTAAQGVAAEGVEGTPQWWLGGGYHHHWWFAWKFLGDFEGDLNTRKRGQRRCKEWVGPGSTLRLGKLGVALGGIGVDWLEAARWGKVSLWCWHTNYGVRQRDEKGPQKWKQFSHSHPTISGQNTWPRLREKKNLCLHGVSQRLRKREWHGTPAPDSSEISNMEVLTNPKMQSGRQTRKGLRDSGWKLEVNVHSFNQSV